jgi:subtilase family serine protease
MPDTLRGLCLAIALIPALAGAALAQAQTADAPQPLITQLIDETNLVTLAGNTRPEANAANDRGAIPSNTPIDHIHLQLTRGAAGESAAAAFVAAQHDPASPQFHQWMTPEAFGARFGAAPADIDIVTAWLASHGFVVDAVYPSRLVIEFSGAAGQVASAFHTELHRFDVDGVSHIANVSDPQIPAALAPVVAGPVSLHDFRAQPRRRPRVTPRDTAGGGVYAVAPADLAKIYNFNAAFNAGYTGKGQMIAVAEDTNLYADTDWTTFRADFNLKRFSTGSLVVSHPAPKNGKSCGNPGVNGDDSEATLDVQWSSAAAPGAEILLASCANSATTDGVYLAIQNLVNGSAPPPIISISYGYCETENGAAANAAFAKLYQQAAAEGISVFVATGDNGPSDCANGGNGATLGIGANGWATTQYNVAVGGTDFGDTYSNTNATYWNKANSAYWGSAKSYVPEIPWNDTCASTLIAKYSGFSVTYGANGFCNSAAGESYLELGGGEGAPSGCATGKASTPGVVSGTCKGTPKPSWQSGVLGIPADGVRDTPDVSLFAANGVWGHYYVSCFTDPNNGGGPCTGNPADWAGDGGGTSFSTPIWAGIQALVNQKLGTKQGNPAPTLYALAAKQYGKSGDAACDAKLGNKIGSSCVFLNVTVGDDDIDCVKGSPDCYRPSGTWGVLSTSTTAYHPAYLAGVGYNFPTGIGTVNVANLLAAWPATH